MMTTNSTHQTLCKALPLLLEELSAQLLNVDRLTSMQISPNVDEITLDIKEVKAGVLFIARSLWYINTHQWVLEAAERGAVAVIVSEIPSYDLSQLSIPIYYIAQEDPSLGIISSRFYEHPTRKLKVYGVTGTNGKTSTVSFLKELLTACGEKVASMGTVGYCFAGRCIPAANTTPDALVIQRFAYDVWQAGASALVLEVSSHGLALQRVAGIAFDAVGFTSLGRDHLDFHSDFEEYKTCKALLFSECLQASIDVGKSVLAVTHNTIDGQFMMQHCPSATHKVICHATQNLSNEFKSTQDELVIKYGTAFSYKTLELLGSKSPSLEGLHLCMRLAHISCLPLTVLNTPQTKSSEIRDQEYSFHTPLIGDYHQENLAIALAMLSHHHSNYFSQACQAMETSSGVAGRMQLVTPAYDISDTRVALIDYAHTPDAISRAIQALRHVHDGHITVLIGCGGDRDRGKRPWMLHAACHNTQRVVLTADNPRSEDISQIMRDTLDLTLLSTADRLNINLEKIQIIEDRRDAIHQAWHQLPPNSALLITGKGHETYQDIKNKRYHLYDLEAIYASIYAQELQIDSSHIPLALSMGAVQLESLTPKFATTNSSISTSNLTLKCQDLIHESSMRQGGLSIILHHTKEPTKIQLNPHILHLTIDQEQVECTSQKIEELKSLWQNSLVIDHHEIISSTDHSVHAIIHHIIHTLIYNTLSMQMSELITPAIYKCLQLNESQSPNYLNRFSSIFIDLLRCLTYLLHAQHRCIVISHTDSDQYLQTITFIDQLVNQDSPLSLHYIVDQKLHINELKVNELKIKGLPLQRYSSLTEWPTQVWNNPKQGGKVLQKQQAMIPNYTLRVKV
jgi:UDP-N-acetylmuramoyl-L-alanyl-D-glutamate--2,6-diaminopimelate ligase